MELITATKHCEGQVVDKFPLRQFLGETENSTVFLTERENGDKAAIKFVPAEAYEGTKQLAYWKRGAQLSHPHLIKIFETGRCQLSGLSQVYAVMDYADENLSEILPSRALTSDEVKDMLVPLLDCLGFLHGSGFVHGHLRPGNIMAVNNQLKLSSEGIRQAGEAYPSTKKKSSYDPPEARTATLSPSADVWSLGITLVEVLTQRVPDWETSAGEPVIPASVPEPFREIARNCLKRDPNARWTVPQIKARMNPAKSAPAPVATPSRPVAETKPAPKNETDPGRNNKLMAVLAIVIVLALVGAVVLFGRKGSKSTATSSPAPPPATEQVEPVAPKPPAAQSSRGASNTPRASQGDVVRQVPPNIPASAQRTIRGRIKLRVRVHVDPAGNVTHADLVSAGPSRYFAGKVVDAARAWKFAPSGQSGERRWMLHFDLTRRGNGATAEPL